MSFLGAVKAEVVPAWKDFLSADQAESTESASATGFSSWVPSADTQNAIEQLAKQEETRLSDTIQGTGRKAQVETAPLSPELLWLQILLLSSSSVSANKSEDASASKRSSRKSKTAKTTDTDNTSTSTTTNTSTRKHAYVLAMTLLRNLQEALSATPQEAAQPMR